MRKIYNRLIVIAIVVIFGICFWISLGKQIPHASPTDYGERW